MSGRSEERAWLSLGGNLGDPARAMGAALRMLEADRTTRIVKVSSLYRTPPWGKTDQPDFLNAAAEVATTHSPRQLLQACLDAELALKRVRQERWGPRIVDLDILMFGDRAVDEDGLHIPHPRMLQRAFVLIPLAEIAPERMFDGMKIAARASAANSAGIERLPGRDWWKA